MFHNATICDRCCMGVNVRECGAAAAAAKEPLLTPPPAPPLTRPLGVCVKLQVCVWFLNDFLGNGRNRRTSTENERLKGVSFPKSPRNNTSSDPQIRAQHDGNLVLVDSSKRRAHSGAVLQKEDGARVPQGLR